MSDLERKIEEVQRRNARLSMTGVVPEKDKRELRELYAERDRPSFLLVPAKTGEPVEPTLLDDSASGFVCPGCGHKDVGTWADDGEADLADWYQCEKFSGGCGESGAVVSRDDPTRTQNGVRVP